MNAPLYRENAEVRDLDISYSHIGPGHERAYFSLIPLAGYASTTDPDKPYGKPPPPIRIYTMSGEKAPHLYKTLGAAKGAIRRWIVKWLHEAPSMVSWREEDTGVHFTGSANGIEIAKYYFCPEPRENWHVDFRVWFGGTFYTIHFQNPAQARDAVQDTYSRWLTHAKNMLT